VCACVCVCVCEGVPVWLRLSDVAELMQACKLKGNVLHFDLCSYIPSIYTHTTVVCTSYMVNALQSWRQ